MKDVKAIAKALDLIGTINHIPVFVLAANGTMVFAAAKEVFPREMALGFAKTMDATRITAFPSFHQLSRFEMCMAFRVAFADRGDCVVLLGPGFCQKPESDSEWAELSYSPYIDRRLSLPRLAANVDTFTSITLAQLASLILLIITGEDISPVKMLGNGVDNEDLHSVAENMYSRMEDPTRKYNYEQEKSLAAALRQGNVTKLRKILQFFDYSRVGTLSKDPRKEVLYISICTIALTTRVAIEAGIVPAKAYAMSDQYIAMMDEAATAKEISMLVNSFLEEIAKLIRDRKISYAGKSEPITKAIAFILDNLNGSPTLKDIAAHLGYSYKYFSRLFKNELKTPFKRYVTKLKVEEAKDLLTYTGKIMPDIAASLGFSSQSYFIKTFRTYEKMTPLQYRRKRVRESGFLG